MVNDKNLFYHRGMKNLLKEKTSKTAVRSSRAGMANSSLAVDRIWLGSEEDLYFF